MIQSQRITTALPLHPLMIQRRRALRVGPPARAAAIPMPALAAMDGIVGDVRSWKDDLSFFLACYAAGLLFFLVMLS